MENPRFGRDSGCGFGMGQMFRALANHDGDLRFRSDDHALEKFVATARASKVASSCARKLPCPA